MDFSRITLAPLAAYELMNGGSGRALNMNKAIPTIKDVAEAAGVSKSTVSRCLNDPSMVRPSTLERVQKAIAEIGYIMDATASEYSRKQSSFVSLLIPSVRSSLFANLTDGVESVANAAGLTVLIGQHQYSAVKERALLESWMQRRLCGLIVTGLFDSNLDLLPRFKALDIPCVITYERMKSLDCNYAGIDNPEAASRAIEYLISLNHKRIAVVIASGQFRRARKRLEGVIAALKRNGLAILPEYIIETVPTILNGSEAAMRLLSLPKPPTAIFCVGDALAMGAMASIKESGRRIPEDISVIGFDDADFAAYCDPPLTTVRIPSFQMGELAMKIIHELKDGKSDVTRMYKLPTELILRKSCGICRE